MLKLKRESPLVRETAGEHKGRALIVELHRGFMVLRVKGLRSMKYSLSYEAARKMPAKRGVNRGVLRV